MAITVKIDPDNPDPRLISRVAFCLQNDGIVAFPTETVYGLAASINSMKGIQRVLSAKQRPDNKPLPVQIAHASQLGEVWRELPHHAMPLIEAFMPGPLTLIYYKHPSIDGIVNGGRETLGVRIPQHAVSLAIIEALGEPIVAPSANISGDPAPVRATDISADLRASIDIVVDSGQCPGGLPSTVLDISQKPAKILRLGAISKEELELFLQVTE